MAPPLPVEGEVAAEGQRTIPTPFLTKTYQLVEDTAVDDVIAWNEDGSTFVVWRPAEFARDLLPKYFKHNNFSSFVRQLNTYGFRKVVPDRWEFANDCFRRGEKRMLCDIQRRKVPACVAQPVVPVSVAVAAVPANTAVMASPANSGDLSSNSSPRAAPAAGCSGSGSGSGGSAELREENERLRRENARLSHELSQLRSMFDTIYALVSKHASGRRHGGGGEAEAASVEPLELMPPRPVVAEEEEEEEEAEDGPSPRLFGVSIGAKRARGEDGEEAQRTIPEVKSEPLDPGSDPWDEACGGDQWSRCQRLCNGRDHVT